MSSPSTGAVFVQPRVDAVWMQRFPNGSYLYMMPTNRRDRAVYFYIALLWLMYLTAWTLSPTRPSAISPVNSQSGYFMLSSTHLTAWTPCHPPDPLQSPP